VNNDEGSVSDEKWLSGMHTPIYETEEFEIMAEFKNRTNSDSKSELPTHSQFKLEIRIPKEI
jgi:hypothetical protein